MPKAQFQTANPENTTLLEMPESGSGGVARIYRQRRADLWHEDERAVGTQADIDDFESETGLKIGNFNID